MKVSKAVDHYRNLKQVMDEYMGKTSYISNCNLNRLEPTVKQFEEMIVMDNDFKRYEDQVSILLSKVVDRDEDGNPVIVSEDNNTIQYRMRDEHVKEFQDGKAHLEEEYRDAIEQRTQQITSANEYLNSEVEIEYIPLKIKVEALEGLSNRAITALIPFMQVD